MRKKLILLSLQYFLFFSSCSKKVEKYSYEKFYMSTIFEIVVYSEKNKSFIENTIEKAFTIISNYEEKYSVNKENSIIYLLNKNKYINIDYETYYIISNSIKYSELTAGLFDITIFPIVKLWGFNNQKYNLPNSNEIINTLKNVNYKNIILTTNSIYLKNNSELDLGGILKGYVVDIVVEFLLNSGIYNGFVNAGGNIKVFGEKPDKKIWTIGIKHPRIENDIIDIIHISSNFSIATSGDYERYFITNNIRYHHIFNPYNGYPNNNNIISVSVLHKNAMDADALSTSLMLLGIEKGINLANKLKIPALFIIETNGNIFKTNSLFWK